MTMLHRKKEIYTAGIKQQKVELSAGFTIIELIVSVGIFTVVMLVAVGALLSIVGVNRKTRAVEEVVNSLHFSLDSMARQIRVATTYHCGNENSRPYTQVGNCPNGFAYFAFEPFGGDPDDATDQIVYRFRPYPNTAGNLVRSIDGGQTFSAVTPPGVVIEYGRFYVGGTSQSDTIQPYVLITIKGFVDLGNNSRTDFNIETMVTQRNIDVVPE